MQKFTEEQKKKQDYNNFIDNNIILDLTKEQRLNNMAQDIAQMAAISYNSYMHLANTNLDKVLQPLESPNAFLKFLRATWGTVSKAIVDAGSSIWNSIKGVHYKLEDLLQQANGIDKHDINQQGLMQQILGDEYQKEIKLSNWGKDFTEAVWGVPYENQEWYDSIDNNWLTQLVGGLTESAIGVAISAIPAVGPALSKAYFFSLVDGKTLKNSLESGVDFNTAFYHAKATASMETLVEAFGGFKFKGLNSIKNQGIKTLLKSTIDEGIEEVLSNLAQPFIDQVFLKNNAINETYGKPFEFAVDTLESFIGGAIGGALFGGASLYQYKKSSLGSVEKFDKVISGNINKYGVEKAQNLYNTTLERAIELLNNKEDFDLETKKEVIKDKKMQDFIKFNEKTQKFEMTQKAKSLKESLLPKQGNKIIDSKKYKINVDLGMKLDKQINILNNETYEKLDEKTKKIVDYTLKHQRNIVFVDDIILGNKYSNGIMYIDINSEAKMVNAVINHETIHKMFDLSKHTKNKEFKEGFKYFLDFVLKDKKLIEEFDLLNAKNHNYSFKEYIKNYKETYESKGYNKEEVNFFIKQEIVANLVEKLVNDNKYLNEIKEKVKKQPKTFKNFFKGMINFFSGNFDFFTTNTIKEIEKLKKENLTSLDKISKMFINLYKLALKVDRPFYTLKSMFAMKGIELYSFLNANSNEEKQAKKFLYETKKKLKTINQESNKMLNNSLFAKLLEKEKLPIYFHALQQIRKYVNDMEKKELSPKNDLHISNKVFIGISKFSVSLLMEKFLTLKEGYSLENIENIEDLENALTMKNKLNESDKEEIAERLKEYFDLLKTYVLENNKINFMYDNAFYRDLIDGNGEYEDFGLWDAAVNFELGVEENEKEKTENVGSKSKNRLKKAFNALYNATKNDYVVDLSLSNETKLKKIKNEWRYDIDFTLDIVGIGKGKHKTENIIDYNIGDLDKIADPITYANIISLFRKKGFGNVLLDKILLGERKLKKVENFFHDTYDKYFAKNYKQIKELEKTYIKVKSLDIELPLSQIAVLRNAMVRELIRNRAIDLEIIKANKTNHFGENKIVNILQNTKNKHKQERNAKEIVIKNIVKHINELDDIINENDFLKEYNNKFLDYMNSMYEFVNDRYIEYNGIQLENDSLEIQNVIDFEENGEEIKKSLLFGLNNEVDFTKIYQPFASNKGNYSNSEHLTFKNILDLGVFSGMTENIRENDTILRIDSMNNILVNFTREVANYYGLHRIMTDYNIMINESMYSNKEQLRSITYGLNKINPKINDYFINLIKDIAGYSTKPTSTDTDFKKFLSIIRKNYYRFSLGLNIKTIFTQLTSIFTLSANYGNDFDFTFKMIKNFFLANKNNTYYLSSSDIFKDRARNTTYDIKQAQSDNPLNANSLPLRIINKTMDGINFTDTQINRAFFKTLVESGKNEYEALKIVELSILHNQSNSLRSGQNELLRTKSDILKMFLKFTGEPFKHITNLVESYKEINLILKIRKHYEDIVALHDKRLSKIKQDISLVETKIEELKKEEINLRLLKQPTYENKKKLKDILSQIKKNENKLSRLQEENILLNNRSSSFVYEIKTLKEDLANANKRLARRLTAMFTSVMYQSILTFGFFVLRGKDEKEEKTIENYFKNYGLSLLNELIGMFPFVKDIYEVVGEGFNINTIDELQGFNSLALSINYLYESAKNGKLDSVKWGKVVRNIILDTSMIFGIPSRNLERLYTTPMFHLSYDSWYKYQRAIGKKKDTTKDLLKAIKEERFELANDILENRLKINSKAFSNATLKEYQALTEKGYKVNITSPKHNVKNEKGDIIKLNKKQVAKMLDSYVKADKLATRIVGSSNYKKLNDQNKAKTLNAIYNYFNKIGKEKALNTKILKDNMRFDSINDAYYAFNNTIIKMLEKQLNK